MIKQIIDTIKNECEKIKSVSSFRYEGRDLINAQNNYNTVQVIVENDTYLEYLMERDLCKLTLNIDILDNVYQDTTTLDVHNHCMNIAIILLHLLDNKFKSIINVQDYSITTVDRYTDDNLSGVRVSLMLIMPSLISICDIDEYYDENQTYPTKEDTVINIDENKINDSDFEINLRL